MHSNTNCIENIEKAEIIKKLEQQLKEGLKWATCINSLLFLEKQKSLRQNSDVKVASKYLPSPHISSDKNSPQSDDTMKKKSTDAATSITVSRKECQELTGRKKEQTTAVISQSDDTKDTITCTSGFTVQRRGNRKNKKKQEYQH